MPAPIITGISPDFAVLTGGDVVAISGTNLNGAPVSVAFGGILSPDVVVSSSTLLNVTVPATSTPSIVQVVVSNSNGVSNQFAFSMIATRAGDASYGPVNPFFDPDANFTVYGVWNFEQSPIFPPSPASDFYSIEGNSDLNNSSYLGSLNSEPLNVGTGGIVVLRIDDAQDVIWANVPDYEIHVTTTFLLASPSIQFTGPASVSPIGLFNVVADASGHLSFSNIANASSLVAWDVGGNLGLANPSVLGTLDAAGINIQTNATNAITISSAQVITMPALTVAPGGQKILMVDPTTFQLYISP